MRNDIEGIVGASDEGSRLEVSSLGDEVASRLYDALVDGRLPPGSRLSEAALARSFGISRGPIREALRVLERRRLLRFEPRRGFFVRDLSAREVEDLFEVRAHLERLSVRLACERGSAAEMAAIEGWVSRVAQLDLSGEEVSAGQLVELDLLLHRMICAMSGNGSLISLFDTVLGELRLALAMINRGFRQHGRLVRSHDAVIAALLKRDADAAEEAMATHLRSSLATLLARLEAPRDEAPLPG